MGLVGAVMMAGAAKLLVPGAGMTTAALQASGGVLVTLLLGSISKEIRTTIGQVENALEKAKKQVREMRQAHNAA